MCLNSSRNIQFTIEDGESDMIPVHINAEEKKRIAL